jgi:hypothetical protein
VSRTSRVCVLEGADACCWKASNRLQADPCAIYLSRPHLKQHTCPSHNDSPHPLSRLHQFQVPIFVRHLPNTNSPESPYCNDRLLAVSTPTLLLLRRFLNGSTTSSRTRKCVLYFLLLGLLLCTTPYATKSPHPSYTTPAPRDPAKSNIPRAVWSLPRSSCAQCIVCFAKICKPPQSYYNTSLSSRHPAHHGARRPPRPSQASLP